MEFTQNGVHSLNQEIIYKCNVVGDFSWFQGYIIGMEQPRLNNRQRKIEIRKAGIYKALRIFLL